MSIVNYHFRILVEDTPDYYYRGIQTDVMDEAAVDPSNPSAPVKDYVVEIKRDAEPGTYASGLVIHCDVGSAIVDDQTVITADVSNIKYCLVSLVRDDVSGLLEIQVQEKVLGNYAETPDDKEWLCDIGEYSLEANGTDLVLL